MKINFTKKFIDDLNKHPNLISKVLKTFDKQGELIPDINDHKYRGLKHLYIRYLSRGDRLIYYKKDGVIIYYRCGPHSIEDNLSRYIDSQYLTEIVPSPTLASTYSSLDFGCFLYKQNKTLLSSVLKQMIHLKHLEIALISPFISNSLFMPVHPIGRFIYKAIEEDTYVRLITKPPSSHEEMKFYEYVDSQGVILSFLSEIHSKLYMFEIDKNNLLRHQQNINYTVIVGSANFTVDGLSFDGIKGNEELCFRIPISHYNEAKRYVESLTYRSIDFASWKKKYSIKLRTTN